MDESKDADAATPCSTPRVLFLHANQPCYVAEPLFHGLRTLLGAACVDVPRYDSAYSPLSEMMKLKLRGHGFSLYGLLPDLTEVIPERYLWKQDLESWDLIIIANVWDQGELSLELQRVVSPDKLILIDGYDTSALFPFAGRFANRPWLYLNAHRKCAYFKREMTNGGEAFGLSRFLPKGVLRRIRFPKRVFPIGFSFPAEKISRISVEEKTKEFTRHIVDEEVAQHIDGSFFSATGSDRYVFTSEESYYADLQISRFGITTRRAGWDCLRHYEMAANGCVLCFRDLEAKPATCAPHGLDETNSISYRSYEQLMATITRLEPDQYRTLQAKSYDWIESHTTRRRAMDFLQKVGVRTPRSLTLPKVPSP